MATTFLEPGGDATFNVATTSAGGFWGAITNTPAVVTDFVHGTHQKSIKYKPLSADIVDTPAGTISDSGSRYSIYIYLNALPGATGSIINCIQLTGGIIVARLRLTTAGVLQLWNDTVQIGSSGPTLSTGTWYRISLAYTITSTTVNRFETFVNGVSAISVTNATLGNVSSTILRIGNVSTDSTLDLRTSDHYVDNSSSLTDPGNIWVTAKRSFANGTTNGFSTQIGSGGSGYGSGHAQQVNERPLSNANGWSMIGAGSAVTEEYTIESQGTGDIDIRNSTIVDFMGWVDAKSALSETGQIIVAGTTTNISLTSTETVFTQFAGSTTYPQGGTDIGIVTSSTVTTVSLYECGIQVAYIPNALDTTLKLNNYQFVKVGDGMSTSEKIR